MVTPDDHRRLELAACDHLVERESKAMPIAQSDPADAGWQSLKSDPGVRHVQPAVQGLILGQQLLHALIDPIDVLRIARQRDPAKRPDPAAEQWPDVGWDESGNVEGVVHALG